MKNDTYKKFGKPYAVFNLSKMGLRYFRICMNASQESKERLASHFINHPNVGWIFYAEGWFNLAIGVWAKDNAEINDIGEQIRNVLGPKDEIVLQSELTSLYSFGDRKITGDAKPMSIIDSTIRPIDLSPIEIDYIKLMALDSSITKEELCAILNIDQEKLGEIERKLSDTGVIIGHQNRITYSGSYFKVFIDSLSKKNEMAVADFIKNIWNDKNCIYFGKANNKYDIEFELVLDEASLINDYVRGFSDFKVSVLTENVYTNLYPMNKIANLKEIRETFLNQKGNVIDFRNSKLWYLNHEAAKSYLNIYNGNKKYFETMEKNEIDIFPDIVQYLQENQKDSLYNISDIGSGDGLKGRLFIERLGEKDVKAYYPIDIQPIELAAALHAHSNTPYAKHPTLLNIENLSARFPLSVIPGEKQVYLFLGGTYGNFEHEKINSYLKSVLSDTSTLLVSMPVREAGKSDQEIVDTYSSLQYEDIAFGPLMQIGFKKGNFKKNRERDGFIVHIEMENDCLTGSFILNEDVEILGKKLPIGTVFKMLTSWKPTLAEFRDTLEKDFIVKKMFCSKGTAIAMIRDRKIAHPRLFF
ncbi:MAG: hypothetical protein UY41_C0033G0009 [Candidatus Moranbacteria bacterium GW2011_GWE1_49_15]|nr:MAG: hypothetical protein UX75_C0043G0007 [Candidatus Moranbacteria bacterium GW2011_GWE2_47_10]KKW06149.1 MAG: hypothetical protein UY41_C0033G0009 [Candidatus Moranbacteria bacterium GW2011_GWE1_49_15]HBP01592.1 hypothetical protein [Candidatus Moranbacteria bacterium]